MSDIRLATGYLVLGDPIERDDLCEKCFHWGLVSFPVHFVGEVGVIEMPNRVECPACWESK